MKAAAIQEHGGVDKITVLEMDDPKPGRDEVLVDVRAAALNHLDLWVRQGHRALKLAMPHILGSDAAGVVAEVGEDVRGVDMGAEIVIDPGLSCGVCEFCLRGEQSECVSYGIVGMNRAGTFAERVAVPARCIHAKPSHLSWEEAAALPLAYMTAWRMLLGRAKVIPGETVLIHGIGGGVALAALQLCAHLGAKTIVTSSSDDKLERAGALGAKHAINYKSTEDVAKAVLDRTDGRGADIAFDTVGSATWGVNFDALRRGGRIVICGVTSGRKAETNLQQLYWKQLTAMGSTMGSHEEFRQLLAFVETAGLEPVIDSVHPLADAAQAAARMEAGEQFGKIVLRIEA